MPFRAIPRKAVFDRFAKPIRRADFADASEFLARDVAGASEFLAKWSSTASPS